MTANASAHLLCRPEEAGHPDSELECSRVFVAGRASKSQGRLCSTSHDHALGRGGVDERGKLVRTALGGSQPYRTCFDFPQSPGLAESGSWDILAANGHRAIRRVPGDLKRQWDERTVKPYARPCNLAFNSAWYTGESQRTSHLSAGRSLR